MADLVVPRLGVSVTEVEILEWLVSEGGTVSPGDPVVSVATDKTEVEIEATAAGTLKRGASVGDVCQVGDAIGAID
jgi:pyruvate/2-oxoglutarate dehydrogenase complex dihydrolipoamide acyltransferase (E2) component